jgi:hypothetical protein
MIFELEKVKRILEKNLLKHFYKNLDLKKKIASVLFKAK